VAKSVTSLTQNGLRDWILQRISAVYMILYIVMFTVMCFLVDKLTYEIWSGWFSNQFIRIATILFFISLLIHTWIGIWTVTTDYITSILFRNVIHFVVLISLIAFLFWGIEILWGFK